MSTFPTVLVCRKDFPEDGILLLQSKCKVELWEKPGTMPRDELLRRINGKDALYCTVLEKINTELLDAAGPNLKTIGTYSAGYDHIDLEECRKRGISVGNTPDLNDTNAELTMALLLATSRRLIEANKEITNGGWKTDRHPLWMCGAPLAGSTVGIVGLGRIGYGVAERLQGFKVKNILYSGNNARLEATQTLEAKYVSFEELIKQSDFVIVCCALTPSTKGLFNLEAFKAMKRSAIFINISRGLIVNHEDLYTALTTGLIRAAGLDVMNPEPVPEDHKLTKLPNCVLLPHIGGATVENRTTMSILTAENILAGLEGKSLPYPI